MIGRYILKEILPYFGLTLLILTAIILGYEMSRFSELFIKKNVPPELIRTLLVAGFHRVLIVSLPVSLLVAAFLALGRLSSDNELISLLGCGISRKQILMPLLGLSAAASISVGYLTLVDLPRSARRFREIQNDLLVQGLRTQIKPRVFDLSFPNRVLYVHDVDRKTDLWNGIFLSVSDKASRPTIFTARQGILELGDPPETSQIHLKDGVKHWIDDKDGQQAYHSERFSSYHVRLGHNLAGPFEMTPPLTKPLLAEKTVLDLLRIRSRDDKLTARARIEAHKRLALPFSCILFAMMGTALSVSKRGGRSFGFLFSLFLVAVYYFAMFGGENLASAGKISPFLAIWFANFAFGFLGLIGLTERKFFHRLQDLIGSSSARLGSLWQKFAGTNNRLAVGSQHYIRRRGSTRRIFRLIDRYFALLFLKYFILSLVSLLSIFLLFTLLELSSEVIENGTPWLIVLSYLFYLALSVVEHLTPPSLLIASLLVFGILTKTNETTALRASGVTVYRMAFVTIAVCCGLAAWMAVWQDSGSPTANKTQDQLRYFIKHGHPAPKQAAWVKTNDGNWILGKRNRIFYFRDFKKAADCFYVLSVFNLNQQSFNLERHVEASVGCWDKDQQVWVLQNVRELSFIGEKISNNKTDERLLVRLEESPDYFYRETKKIEYMSGDELKQYLSDLQQTGLDVTELRVAMAQRNALPVACIVMVVVGIPFGLTWARRGALLGIALGVILGLSYWMAIGFFEQLGRYEYVSSWLAGWCPSGLFGLAGVYLLFWRRG
jgi:LPS export ABC transporter permease LptF/LPS export ABC transporter permease LptG